MKKKQKAKPAKKAEIKDTLVAFLLDRSGSMSSIIDDTIGGFNTYLENLRKDDPGTMRFTLTQFDTESVDVVCNAVSLDKVNKLSKDNYVPRAGTPLYDAMGKTMQRIAGEANGRKVLFVTLTDGQENSSHEWNEGSVRKLIKEREDNDHWTFAYIGLGLEGWAAALRIAAGTRSYSNVANFDQKDSKRAYSKLSKSTLTYASSVGGQNCSLQNFWDATKDAE